MSAAKAAWGLQRLTCFTITTANLAHSARAYTEILGYQSLAETEISATLAAHWNMPALRGVSCALLHAPAGTETILRLVEQPDRQPGAMLLGHGWNAMEVLVQDPYVLARELIDTAFKVLVAPRPLPFDASIHAMQVQGPAGELLYMTALPTDRMILDLPAARCRVDRPFIAILGGPDMAAMQRYYCALLRTAVLDPQPVLVQIVNEQFSLPADHRIPLGIVKMPRDYLIEIDELPAGAKPHPQTAGQLTRGIAMVSFEYPKLDSLDLAWLQPPRAIGEAPYRGRRTGVTLGAAGEWIELIEC